MGMSKMTADVERVSCWSNEHRRCVHPSIITRTTFCIDCNTFLFIEPGSIYQGPVAVSPPMNAPLDLHALEARLTIDEHPATPRPWRFGQLAGFPANKFILAANDAVVAEVHWMGFREAEALAVATTDARALLTALRAHRAALQRYVTASAPSSLLVDQGIAALASCTDHEGAK